MRREMVLGAVIGAGLLAITVVGQQAPPNGAPSGGPGGAPGGGIPANIAAMMGKVESIEKIADGLYRIPNGGGASAVFVRSDGVLLVDTKVPGNGQNLLNQIRKVTDKPVTHIVNTHTHADHTGSNDFFPSHVEIVAQENTAASMSKMDAFKSVAGKVGLPDRTFKNKLTLFKGKEAVDLYYFGPAHTSGDTFVVFRDARVMHAGDVFANKGLPLVDTDNGGSGVAYGETIRKAAAGIRNVDKVITGHSDVMVWQDFVDFGEFTRLLADQARAAVKNGQTAEQALDSLKLPETFKNYDLTGMMPAIKGMIPENRAASMQATMNELKKL
jgi:cyclase